MTIFQRIAQPFQKLISKLNKDDETEATICDELDPYMISVVKSLNENAVGNVVVLHMERGCNTPPRAAAKKDCA